MNDSVAPDLSHPSALTRLTSTVLRFRCPSISSTSAKLNYIKSFKTVGTHETTQKALKAVSAEFLYLFQFDGLFYRRVLILKFFSFRLTLFIDIDFAG